MDEGEQQHSYYQYPSVTGAPRHVVQQQQQSSPVYSPGNVRLQAAAPSRRRRARHSSSAAGSGASRPAQHRQNISSAFHFQQSPTPLSYSSVRQNVLGLHQQQQVAPPGQYHARVVYNFDQSGMPQVPYTISTSEVFTARQADSLSVLSPGVSQYFPPAGQDERISQYLSTQEQVVAPQQSQQNSLSQRTAGLSNTNTMGSFDLTGTTGPAPNVANLDDAFSHYEQALIRVFHYTQRNQLNEASRLLLEISTWLIANARDLGLFHDDPNQHAKHVELWKDFNICWLSLCQKQKDLTEAILATGQAVLPTNMLSAEVMEDMGQAMIRFCDTVEPHGLVDYQMGIWEEEILDILGQCLDLVEQ